ncbi:MAG: DUF4038 domain-containing protein [Luteitalea sp.]|nr:DUF4038 domain-containing protein [Luteitalea sp.]
MSQLTVSGNRRFLQTRDGQPFFWLGDTAWLLFERLDREEVERYLENRRRKGFNVVQVMVIRSAESKNAYGSLALTEGDPARPRVTPGSDPDNEHEYDYWDHVDWIVSQAAARGIYVGMVAAWGSVVDEGILNAGNVRAYARFLAERYRDQPNIVWLTGGDTHGNENTEVWRALGETLNALDPNHLITFHPFGRTQSSTWFHDEPWLDFNMFQSGHRRYGQDSELPDPKGEDNWRYVEDDLAKHPPKPTLDGEPSYEEIPQGLHDPAEPYWTADDVRRYAYWSVFAGSFGHTYGHNAVMQMHAPDSGEGAYGVRSYWYDAIDAPGAGQLQHLNALMLSRPFFERVPDQGLIDGENGERYERVIATRGSSYALIYTYTGRPFTVRMGRIGGERVRAWWFDPRTGNSKEAGALHNEGVHRFDPPGAPRQGNDWVLVLDDTTQSFAMPGTGSDSR